MAAMPYLRHPSRAAGAGEPAFVRVLLVGIALTFLTLFLFTPLVFVFVQALRKGIGVYLAAITEPDAVDAIRLTLLVAVIAVPANLAFGIAAAWTIAKFTFPGKNVLVTLIDLPFSASPVVSGLIYVLIFGLQGWFGGWLQEHDVKVIFAVPGIVLATIFVTFSFVARELIPLMQAQGTEQEEAATVLGAGGWQTFVRVTLPNVKWGLLYGVILCNARAMGEFGAVSVVSGHIRGATNTLPLHVEILYNEYQRPSPWRRCLLCLPLSRWCSSTRSSGARARVSTRTEGSSHEYPIDRYREALRQLCRRREPRSRRCDG